MQEWTASEPARLDVFVSMQHDNVSREQVKRAIQRGFILVNGIVTKKPATLLEIDDTVSAPDDAFTVTTDDTVTPTQMTIEILYEDDACFVIDKPAGISVHPGAAMDQDEKTLLHGLAYLFQERSLPFSSGNVLVHRLDKETTGCLLIAKTPQAHTALQAQFAARSTKKLYLAIVSGVPLQNEAVIDAPIGRSTSNRTKMSVRGASQLRDAKTSYEVLDAVTTASLLRCTLHTGRTHQLRVHLHAIHHPILGDETYYSSESHSVARAHGIADLCLHALQLTFVSPATDSEHTVEAPLPQTLLFAAQKLGLQTQ